MKRFIPILCICIACIFLMSSVGVALLPAEHDCCMRKGCTVCLLIPIIERLLHSLLPIVALAAVLRLLHLPDKPAWSEQRRQRTASETPVQLMDKLSN